MKLDLHDAVEPGWSGFELDIDPTKPLSAADQERFRSAFYQHHLIIIRAGIVDLEAQAALASYIAPALRTKPDSMGYVSNVREDGYLGTIKLAFHQDLFFGSDPYRGLSLHAIDVDGRGSPTRFANAARACQLLPQKLKRRLEGLSARHVYGERDLGGRNRLADYPDGWPHIIRLILWKHPATGIDLLGVNYGHTDCIVGLPEDESEALLTEIHGYLYADSNIVEHFWKKGDLVYWDNLVLHHAREEISNEETRTLQRVAFGGKSFDEHFPNYEALVKRASGLTATAVENAVIGN